MLAQKGGHRSVKRVHHALQHTVQRAHAIDWRSMLRVEDAQTKQFQYSCDVETQVDPTRHKANTRIISSTLGP
jgi:hypothetical protein